MIVNMSENATDKEIEHVIERIREAGYQPHVTRGTTRTIVAAVGSGGRRHELEALAAAASVAEVVPIAQPFKLVSRQVKPERSVVDVGGVKRELRVHVVPETLHTHKYDFEAFAERERTVTTHLSCRPCCGCEYFSQQCAWG